MNREQRDRELIDRAKKHIASGGHVQFTCHNIEDVNEQKERFTEEELKHINWIWWILSGAESGKARE